MEKLEYAIAQNKRALGYEVEKMAKQVAYLQALVEGDQWHGFDAAMWTEGHVSEIVTSIAGLMMRQRALVEARRMIAREREQG